MTEEYEDLDFYLDRLNYYYFQLNRPAMAGKQYPGYGEIEFWMDRNAVSGTYDFWREGLIGYFKKEVTRKLKNAKKKNKKKA